MADESEIDVVVLHRVQVAGGKFGWAVAPAELADGPVPEARQSFFALPKGSQPLPGCIYCATGRVEAGRVRKLALQGARFVRRVQGDHATVWRLADEAMDKAKRSEAMERKLRSTPALADEVQALRALYEKLDWRARAAFPEALMGAILRRRG